MTMNYRPFWDKTLAFSHNPICLQQTKILCGFYITYSLAGYLSCSITTDYKTPKIFVYGIYVCSKTLFSCPSMSWPPCSCPTIHIFYVYFVSPPWIIAKTFTIRMFYRTNVAMDRGFTVMCNWNNTVTMVMWFWLNDFCMRLSFMCLLFLNYVELYLLFLS